MGIILLVVLNFAISWFNAWAVGHSWPETKNEGGMPHFLNWMGAIMSACGFTWCYLVLAVSIGGSLNVTDDQTGLTHPMLSPHLVQMTFELGYLIIIGPILGSGLALTVQSWAHFYRKRSLGNGVTAGYNTFAQVYNTYQAVSNVPSFVGDLSGFFKGEDKNGIKIVIFLVIVSLLGGMLTTYSILMHAASSHAVSMKNKARFNVAR